MSCVIGIDFGTGSARALLVRCENGEEIASYAIAYPSGRDGVLEDAARPHLARQHPGDYLFVLERAVRKALELATADGFDFAAEPVVGIGVTATGSSPLPVDAFNRALGMTDGFRDNLDAQCWLWKDHTSHVEAAEITRLAFEHRPHYISRCGNVYSSEWWWSKIWHCLNVAPDVFEAAHSWVELADWVPSQLAGIEKPEKIVRGICQAGHKAMYAKEWGGLPDAEFLAMLDRRLAALRERLYAKAYDASTPAGFLCKQWAQRLGLPEGIAIAIGQMDVHYGAVGCGITEGTLVKVIGTSTCDCAIVGTGNPIPQIPGICGVVNGSILPGYYGVEAGQSAVGDLFKWWVEGVCGGDESSHEKLTAEASELRVGQSGLLALDWNNGNRTILVDQRLSGLLVGQTLHTTPAEIYRALIEATAFGARIIIEQLETCGVPIRRIVCAGGIAEKNPLLMQIYADVTNRELCVSRSDQACALGAALAASVLAGPSVGGHETFACAQAAMTGIGSVRYRPDAVRHARYNEIFALYRQLHDTFGAVRTGEVSQVMKELLRIKDSASTS